MNTYGYVYANPVSTYDFLGLDPGDLFNTEYEAAIDARNYLQSKYPRSVIANREFSAMIYDAGSCKYSYTLFRPGTAITSDSFPLPPGNDGIATANIHNHPVSYPGQTGVATIRGITVDYTKSSDGFDASGLDISESFREGLNQYVINPDGNVIGYYTGQSNDPQCMCKNGGY